MQSQEYIYVAGYPSFPDTVKIGMTTVCPKKRVADWGRDTGAPERPELIAFYPVFDARSVEKRIHTELANFKTDGGGTEWFKNAEHCKDVTRDIADIESALIKEHALKKREEELRLKEQAVEKREAVVQEFETKERAKREREQETKQVAIRVINQASFPQRGKQHPDKASHGDEFVSSVYDLGFGKFLFVANLPILIFSFTMVILIGNL